jgi:hypothetical protein
MRLGNAGPMGRGPRSRIHILHVEFQTEKLRP